MNIQRPRFRNEYFLLLLPLYFVFHGLTENYVSVSFTEALLLFTRYLLATAAVSLLFFLLFRNWRKTALYVFVLMTFYFFFGAVHDGMKKVFPDSFVVRYAFILPFCLFLFILLAVAVHKSKKEFNIPVRYLNLLLILVLLIDIPAFLATAFKSNKQIKLQTGISKCDSCYKPDVYVIVADEYAGQQALSEIFSFDNSRFEQDLANRNFHIIRNSKSNYNYTLYSTASMLSMNFLQTIEGKHFSRKDINICYNAANKSSLWKFFEAHGYDIKNYSLLNINDIPSQVPQPFLMIGKRLITSQTFFSRVNRDIRFNLVTRFKIRPEVERMAYSTRDGNEMLYQTLLTEARKHAEKPRFIYTHLMMPHYPYYYNHSGQPYPLETLTEGNQSNKHRYIQYLQWCNKKFLELIDTILKNSKKPPVIILLGDHGWRHFREPAPIEYQFMNLSSVLLPARDYGAFYNGMSNINLIRVLLNTQFHQKLPLLKDSTIFIKD